MEDASSSVNSITTKKLLHRLWRLRQKMCASWESCVYRLSVTVVQGLVHVCFNAVILGVALHPLPLPDTQKHCQRSNSTESIKACKMTLYQTHILLRHLPSCSVQTSIHPSLSLNIPSPSSFLLFQHPPLPLPVDLCQPSHRIRWNDLLVTMAT